MSLKQILIDVKNIVVRPYYQVRMWEPVWNRLNQVARKRFIAENQPMSQAQQTLIDTIRRDGFAITHLEDLFPGKNVLGEMREVVARLEASAPQDHKKPFLTTLYDVYRQIDLGDPFVRFALSDEVRTIVNAYLGMWAKFYYYTLKITRPVGFDVAPRDSQRWHRDPEDRKMCKVFVYLSDVDETAGPFMYARGSTRGNVYGKLFKQKPPHGYYPPDGAVEAAIKAEDIQACTGRAGTVIFADTSGLHKGGYATAKSRTMSTSGFMSSASSRGVFYTRGEDFQEKATRLSEAARFALDHKNVANRKWKY